MKACVILHNMIIKEEADKNLEVFFDDVVQRDPDQMQGFLQIYRQFKNMGTHTQLNLDLMVIEGRE
jgi:hypothetical protein